MSLDGIRRITEVRASVDPPVWTNPDWRQRFSWLVQGITSAGDHPGGFDLGLFGTQPVGTVLGRWRRLGEHLGLPAAIHARQAHGNRVLSHEAGAFQGLLVLEEADGHVTGAPGILLTASVADCVPASLVDARQRTVAVVHAGWRGVAAGILERSIAVMRRQFGSATEDVWLHCGPAICGRCYEVGPEVHEAVWPRTPAPGLAQPIDLTAALASRSLAAGIAPERVSISTHCTRCGSAGFFSHRAGAPGRQIAFLGVREAGPER